MSVEKHDWKKLEILNFFWFLAVYLDMHEGSKTSAEVEKWGKIAFGTASKKSLYIHRYSMLRVLLDKHSSAWSLDTLVWIWPMGWTLLNGMNFDLPYLVRIELVEQPPSTNKKHIWILRHKILLCSI